MEMSVEQTPTKSRLKCRGHGSIAIFCNNSFGTHEYLQSRVNGVIYVIEL